MDYPPLGPDDMRAARSVAGPLAVAIGPLRCLVEVGEVRALGQPVQGTPGGIAPAERAAELVQFRRDPERRARVGAGCLDERVDAGWP